MTGVNPLRPTIVSVAVPGRALEQSDLRWLGIPTLSLASNRLVEPHEIFLGRQFLMVDFFV